MRRLMMAIAGLTLLGGCPELETADPGGSEPAALTVEPNLIDFGGLVPGQLQTREIRITNSGGQPARFSGTALTGTGSFSVADAALDEELLPGLTATVEVSYAPPGYEVAEATLALITDVPFVPQVELAGMGLAPAIELDPTSFEFDVCEVGCDVEQEVQIRSVGTEVLEIEDLVFEVTSDELLVSYEFATTSIPPGEYESVTLYYQPCDEIPESAYLTVASNDPLQPEASATFTGQAQYAPAVTDTFQQPASSLADILWVLDNSGNMGGYGALFASYAPATLDLLDEAQVDFQIAVVITDMAEFQGAVPVMTSTTPALLAAFHDAIGVGTGGASPEQPLAMATDALTGPLAQPGGPNDGFLREQAGLQVIVYTNEDDQSPLAAGHYVQQLQALMTLSEDLKISGIIDQGTPQPELETAIAATDGMLLDIHEDWWTQLPDLVDGMPNLPNTFDLSEIPIPDTIEVTIDGAPVFSDWEYYEVLDLVVFEPADTPPAGSEVVFTYHPWCSC